MKNPAVLCFPFWLFIQATILASCLAMPESADDKDGDKSTAKAWTQERVLPLKADSGADQDAAADALREKIRKRIDPDLSRVILIPPGIAEKAKEKPKTFDPEIFLKALVDYTGAKDAKTIELTKEKWTGQTDRFDIELDFNEMRFIVQKRTEESVNQENKHLSDEYYSDIAFKLMEAIGATVGEEDISVHATVAGSEDGGLQEEDKNVRVERYICGLSLWANSMIVDFYVDGVFSGLKGRWLLFDYAQSKLYSSITKDEFINYAVDAYIQRGINFDLTGPIELNTAYASAKTDGGVDIVVIEGRMTMPEELEIAEFDIPGEVYRDDSPVPDAGSPKDASPQDASHSTKETDSGSGCGTIAIGAPADSIFSLLLAALL